MITETPEAREKRREQVRVYGAAYRAANREKVRAACRASKAKHPETEKAYRERNKEKHKLYAAQWHQENKQRINAAAKIKRDSRDEATKERDREAKRVWAAATREQRRAYKRKYHKMRSASDPVYRLLETMRSRMWSAVNGTSKSGKTLELIGCSAPELRDHLEAMFKPGMSWDRRTEWHVDHIRPCAAFDLSDPAQQRACFHYTNLRPLWAKENLQKSCKIAA